MRDSLGGLFRRGLLVAVCGAALLLGACGGDDGGTAAPATSAPTTASALAVSQIDTQTCDSNDPQAVNGLSLGDEEDQTDVSMLMPSCMAH